MQLYCTHAKYIFQVNYNSIFNLTGVAISLKSKGNMYLPFHLQLMFSINELSALR